jgi:hypothetical protein
MVFKSMLCWLLFLYESCLGDAFRCFPVAGDHDAVPCLRGGAGGETS